MPSTIGALGSRLDKDTKALPLVTSNLRQELSKVSERFGSVGIFAVPATGNIPEMSGSLSVTGSARDLLASRNVRKYDAMS